MHSRPAGEAQRPTAETAGVLSLRIHQPRPDGIQSKFRRFMNSKCLHQVCPVRRYRVRAQSEQIGDVLVAMALSDELEDLLLARREPRKSLVALRLRCRQSVCVPGSDLSYGAGEVHIDRVL